MFARLPTKTFQQLRTNLFQPQLHRRRSCASQRDLLASDLRVQQDRSVHHLRFRAVQRARLLHHRPLRFFRQPQTQLSKYLLDFPPGYGQDRRSVEDQTRRCRRGPASKTTWEGRRGVSTTTLIDECESEASLVPVGRFATASTSARSVQ